jgi:prepilin signal peptidase PulO-like enzyme (type II secretory pathway)
MPTDRRFTLIVLVLITVIISGTAMTILKVIPPDTMTHLIATIVGVVAGALTMPPPNAVQVAQAVQKIQSSQRPPSPEIIKP